MSIYKEMYDDLFNEVSHAIEILKEAQKKTEELYLREKSPCDITPISPYLLTEEKKNEAE